MLRTSTGNSNSNVKENGRHWMNLKKQHGQNCVDDLAWDILQSNRDDDPQERLGRLMAKLAPQENQAMREVEKDQRLAPKINLSRRRQISGMQRRAKVACAACDTLISPERVERYAQSNCCGKQSCKDRLDRWAKFARTN
ncbi:hypothetical protein [Shimia thalassica]|uniref:hypothetical protein n=1 Tax=Shimia thalassica TaxID=1715693 RepID=UPI0026E18989|nr:hypothetical protein [Shimia thalassica]MDO6483566.1 hypothetical protein [Shimia thalassica]